MIGAAGFMKAPNTGESREDAKRPVERLVRRQAELSREWYFDSIVKELLEGLLTDGAHHKQYTLEVVLRMLCEDSWVDEAKKEFQWEDGISA